MNKLQEAIESCHNDELYCRGEGHFDTANMYREHANALEREYLTVKQSEDGDDVWAMCAGFNSTYAGDSARLGSAEWERAQRAHG